MRSQSGLTLVELSVALAIIALLAGLAVLSGVNLLQSAQLSREMAVLLDDLALVRMSAIARSETWRIRFDPPEPGSTVVRSWVVEFRTPGGATWSEFEQPRTLVEGFGIDVPVEDASPVPLQFNRFGRFGRAETTEVTFCRTQVDAGGMTICRPESEKRILIHGHTGVLGY